MIDRQTIPVLLAALLALAACGGDEAEPADMVQEEVAEAPAAPAAAPAATLAEGTMLDPNAATREELLAVPGMTAERADALVAGRPYQTMLDVDRALGEMTDEERDQVYAVVWKPVNLNTASAEEMELIPGVGERMRHEFEEYRPYRAIEEFRREIGKYVDDAEVARLERYVVIPGS